MGELELRISRWYWQTSAKSLQICSNRARVLIAQAHGRHLRSRFDGVGIANPEAQHIGRIVSRTSGDGVPAHQVSQVRAEPPFRWSPRDGMAVDARRRFKHAFAGGLGRLGQLLLLVNPAIEFLARLHIDADAAFSRAVFRNIVRTVPGTPLSRADRSTSDSGDSESDRSCRPIAGPRSCGLYRQKAVSGRWVSDEPDRLPAHAVRLP